MSPIEPPAHEPGGAAALRRDFDAAFAIAAAGPQRAYQELLAIRVGTDAYLVRLAEVVGLHPGLPIVPVPSRSASLLGIAGLRGAIKPIHDLAALLGVAAGAKPRWLIFPKAAPGLGLAFAELEAHLKLPADLAPEEPSPTASAGSGPVVAGTIVRSGDTPRTLIHLPSVVAKLKEQQS